MLPNDCGLVAGAADDPLFYSELVTKTAVGGQSNGIYTGMVRAVDVVLTKPGYGILSECLANNTALLYTSRGHFVEYDVLVAAMPRFLRSAFIGHDDLFAGRWQPHLDALLAQPAPPESPPTTGAAIAAGVLLDVISLRTDY